jgi:hypothetical protein
MPTVVSTYHPAIDSDRHFFRLNPNRLYRARPFIAGEFGGGPRLIFFAPDGRGRLREVTTVIVRRFAGFRMRLPIITSLHLDDDGSIVTLLRSRGIDPDTMRPRRPVIRR